MPVISPPHHLEGLLHGKSIGEGWQCLEVAAGELRHFFEDVYNWGRHQRLQLVAGVVLKKRIDDGGTSVAVSEVSTDGV